MFKALKALLRRDDKIPSDRFDAVSDLRAMLPRDSAGVTPVPGRHGFLSRQALRGRRHEPQAEGRHP